MRFYAIRFVLLALTDTAIQISLKVASRSAGEFRFDLRWLRGAASEPWIFAAAGGYVLTYFLWMTLVERAPVGPSFAASHLQIITVLIASAIFFHERLNARQVAGAACIIAGIVALAISESRAAARVAVVD